MARGARILRVFAGGDDPRGMPASLPARVRASLAYDAGLYAGALGDLAFACACYAAHNEIAGALADPAPLSTGLRTLAYTERLRGRLTEARRLLERASEVDRRGATSGVRASDSGQAVRIAALLAAVLHDLGEVDAAGEHFARVRELGDAPVARRALWEAEHDLALGRRDRAREATERNIAECRRRGWEGHVAHGHTLIGLALLDGGGGGEGVDGRVAQAEAHLVEARRWAAATGEVEVALRCHELAARLALAAGRPDEGARQALEGLHVAETCGFGPFRARLAVVAARCAQARGAGEATSAAALADAAVAWAGEDAWARADALHWAGVARAAAARGEERAAAARGEERAAAARGGERAAAARGGELARGRELLTEAAALRERLRHPEAGASRAALAELG
ncbi:hypothetical protein [Sorangium sp. So ce394]|uniref:hypothetical protein n=1 Tax=Sorangium sp. So ce394 TaxID=3133310 RepID=UPI003F5B7EC8